MPQIDWISVETQPVPFDTHIQVFTGGAEEEGNRRVAGGVFMSRRRPTDPQWDPTHEDWLRCSENFDNCTFIHPDIVTHWAPMLDAPTGFTKQPLKRPTNYWPAPGERQDALPERPRPRGGRP